MVWDAGLRENMLSNAGVLDRLYFSLNFLALMQITWGHFCLSFLGCEISLNTCSKTVEHKLIFRNLKYYIHFLSKLSVKLIFFPRHGNRYQIKRQFMQERVLYP